MYLDVTGLGGQHTEGGTWRWGGIGRHAGVQLAPPQATDAHPEASDITQGVCGSGNQNSRTHFFANPFLLLPT